MYRSGSSKSRKVPLYDTRYNSALGTKVPLALVLIKRGGSSTASALLGRGMTLVSNPEIEVEFDQKRKGESQTNFELVSLKT